MNDKREKILNAALELFTEKGIDSTSTASIAKKAGVGTGTVFHYFSNKEELVNECFKYTKLKLRSVLEMVQGRDFMEQTRLYWSVAVNWYLDNQIEALFLNLYQHDPKVNNGKVLAVISEMSSFISDFFEKARSEGLFKNISIHYLSALAQNNTIFVAQYIKENRDVDKEEFIKSSCECFLQGILSPDYEEILRGSKSLKR